MYISYESRVNPGDSGGWRRMNIGFAVIQKSSLNVSSAVD